METNQNLVQNTPQQSPEPGYDPAKVSQIASVLCELLDPAYILLFGRSAGLYASQ